MAENRFTLLTSQVDATVNEAVGRLVSCDMLNGRYRISLPILMPSGAYVDVSVYPEPGDSFMVTDGGCAFREADDYAATSRSFKAVARELSARAGVDFDGATILMLRVKAEQLKAAIVTIGNVAAQVAAETVERSLKAHSESARDQLFERVELAFPGAHIEHDAEILGASTASYKFDATVAINQKVVAFDLFGKDPISIAATFTKLSDVSRAENGPGVVGVTKDPDKIGPKLSLISSVAKVIRLDAGLQAFQKTAA